MTELHRRRESFRSSLEDLGQRVANLERAVLSQQDVIARIFMLLEEPQDGERVDN